MEIHNVDETLICVIISAESVEHMNGRLTVAGVVAVRLSHLFVQLRQAQAETRHHSKHYFGRTKHLKGSESSFTIL